MSQQYYPTMAFMTATMSLTSKTILKLQTHLSMAEAEMTKFSVESWVRVDFTAVMERTRSGLSTQVRVFLLSALKGKQLEVMGTTSFMGLKLKTHSKEMQAMISSTQESIKPSEAMRFLED